MYSLYKIEPYAGYPCSLKTFLIKGQEAETTDFGEGRDNRDELDLFEYDSDIVNWGCCNYIFECDPELKEYAMEKYNLTEDEYNTICNVLTTTLSIRECGWCV